jgi:tRNA A58 N-methylase Trm61
MAYMVKPDGHVLGIEKHQELADISLTNIGKADGELLKSGLLEIRAGNVLGGTMLRSIVIVILLVLLIHLLDKSSLTA